MKSLSLPFSTLILCLLAQLCAGQVIVDLSGTWSFKLDETLVGEREHWFEKDLEDEILLPSSTDERGFESATYSIRSRRMPTNTSRWRLNRSRSLWTSSSRIIAIEAKTNPSIALTALSPGRNSITAGAGELSVRRKAC